MDVWVTQVDAGQSYNLTHGRFHGLVNPSLRTLGFSPDAALVTFWTRGINGSDPRNISIWAVPTLGGEPRPYLEGAAEFDWSRDGARLVYHTPGPGDPTFVRDAGRGSQRQPIFVSAPGLHAHFPAWSPDARVHLLRPGIAARRHGHLAHPARRRGRRADHAITTHA